MTDTPWRVEKVGPEPKSIWVCTVKMPPDFICECENEEDGGVGMANRIVTDHNSHDGLLEALERSALCVKAARDFFAGDGPIPDEDKEELAEFDAIIEANRAAIKAATP